MIRQNRLKANLKAGRKSFGMWLQSADPTFAEITALVGFDFFIMDQEHGPGDVQAAMAMMRAAAVTDATAVIRVPSSEPIYLRRIADAGAEGLLVPMVETAEQAREIVDACRFPPAGKRGNAWDATRASGYGVARDYLERAHDELLIMVQIETVLGVRNARAIAEVDGVDVVFIGPTDLSGSVGLPGQTNAPEVEALIAECVAAVRPTGKPLASVPRRGKTWQQVFDDGFLLVAAGSEIFYFRTAAEAQHRDWQRYREGAG
ncbi:HpcH/HpaI aldolase family protein [Labrys wisconsinensis]|uniref:4-hydroxy-2-oxoheptanedioate aldolase n=1 Tax=Labrys wisconsinensis TaxID=425677 RepID=A0ABU0JIA8_9HYPH|nr:aldolase/citrate lyase family protein [Labrys wisconsinensis]MDQ0473989.1 4-hydroxy-2-oxoheptanedioate aldolase [Labrys wisconsinensis]